MRDHTALYQAVVVSNRDPKGQRRITARVPDALGTTVSDWARPATLTDAPMPPGSVVWITFPNGDLRYPVYHVPNDPKHGRIVPAASGLHLLGPGGDSGVLMNGDVHAKGDGGYVTVYAADFEVASSMRFKQNIRPLDFDPVKVVQDAPAQLWNYAPGIAVNLKTRVGPIAEELHPMLVSSEGTVDQSGLIGMLWGAVKQLADRVEELEKKQGAAN